MEKKNTIICLIVVALIVGCAVATIIISGITAKDYNYVQLEVNPRAEFILDKKFKVISVNPLNDDARIVLSDMNLIGMEMDDATTEYLTECARTGFLNVNGVDNACNITVIDGLTQALDVHVTQTTSEFFRENEIMGAVTETYEDRTMFDRRKEEQVCCSNKYKLLTTITELAPSQDIKSLKKMSEVNLIEMVAKKHKDNPFTPTEEEIAKKHDLITTNAIKYNTHMKSISDNSQKEFSQLFDKFQKISTKDYIQDFEKQYMKWQKNKPL